MDNIDEVGNSNIINKNSNKESGTRFLTPGTKLVSAKLRQAFSITPICMILMQNATFVLKLIYQAILLMGFPAYQL